MCWRPHPHLSLEQSQALTAALKARGVEAALTVMPGAGHDGRAFFTEENHKSLVKFLKH